MWLTATATATATSAATAAVAVAVAAGPDGEGRAAEASRGAPDRVAGEGDWGAGASVAGVGGDAPDFELPADVHRNLPPLSLDDIERLLSGEGAEGVEADDA